MNNIAKYAEATSASVALTQTDGHLTFVVTDDGRGFDPQATGYGTGLQGIADRLDAIGGTLEVAQPAGSGHHDHRDRAAPPWTKARLSRRTDIPRRSDVRDAPMVLGCMPLEQRGTPACSVLTDTGGIAAARSWPGSRR